MTNVDQIGLKSSGNVVEINKNYDNTENKWIIFMLYARLCHFPLIYDLYISDNICLMLLI